MRVSMRGFSVLLSIHLFLGAQMEAGMIRSTFRTFCMMRRLGLISPLVAFVAFFAPFGVTAADQFTDLPKESPLLPAATYLVEKGILQSAPLFRPNDPVTRAQAAKVLVAPLVRAEELKKITTSTFSDVPAGQWFTSYAEAARALGIVDSAATFSPSKPVTRVAFLKMLLTSRNYNYMNAFVDLTTPLASDARTPTDWTFPVLRYAIATSLIDVKPDGTLQGGATLTRGEMALLYYRLDMYVEGRRTQALLAETEAEFSNVMRMLTDKNVDQATWAAARAVLASRGALNARPNDPLMKAAVKIAEGFQSLVRGYEAGRAGNLDGAIAAAKNTYALAEKAKSFSPGLTSLTQQIQTIAKNMADEARRMQAKPVTPVAKPKK